MPFAQYSRGSRYASPSLSDPYDIDRVQRSIQNARTRIEDAGYKPQDADTRNWFERATNLPEGQNAFFDVLELISRPGQAVLNVMDKVPEGRQSIGQAAARGFAGRDRVRGSEIAEEQLGVTNGVGKALLGTALEIFTDPTNLIPAGGVAKGFSKFARPVGQATKQGYLAVENLAPRMKQIREEVVQPGSRRFADAAGRAFIPDYKLDETLYGAKDDTITRAKQAAENDIRYRTEESMRTISDAAKTAGGVEAGAQVGRIMEAPLRQFEDAKAYEFPDGVRRTENKSDLFTEIGTKRNEIKDVSKGIRGEQQQYDSAIRDLGKGIDQTDREIRRMFSQIERINAKNLDKQTRANLREATRELQRIQSQLNNFSQHEVSLLKYYKKQVKDQHEARFDLVKKVRQAAPNGIKGVNREALPVSLKNAVRVGGKGIDEIASQLGYTYADDLLRDLSRLDGLPRRLDDAEVERLARQEIERTGAIRELDVTRQGLEATKGTLTNSIRDIGKGDNAARSEQQAFLDIEQNPRYQELIQQREVLKHQKDNLFGEAAAARQSRLDQIKAIEDEIVALRESARNPVMVQKELPRPVRDMPSDPGIQQAARMLIRSNNAIREWARSNDISINEIEGYMSHILAAEERARRKRKFAVDRGNFGTGQPNKGVTKSREIPGSAEDINERLVEKNRLQEGEKFFEDNAFFATAIGQKKLIEYGNAVTFRRQVLTNPNFATRYEKGMDVPQNAVVIDTNNYTFMKNAEDVLEGAQITDEIGGEYIVTKSVKTALDRYQKLTTDDGINGFLKAWDTAQSFWKRGALFSVLYHVRNDIGAKFNNWVGGMSLPDLAKYSAQADREVYNAVIRGKESDLFNEYRRQGLYSTGLSQIEYARAGEDAEKAIQRTIEKRSKLNGTLRGRLKAELSDLKNPLNAFETSREFGDFIDQTNRFALYKWARDKGMSPEEAAKKVRTVQFDYSRTTPFEREVIVRMVPFYRWMRNNLPYQLKQFIHDPRKYNNLNKLRLNAIDAAGMNEENVPDWMKESFAIPVTSDGQGSGKFLGLNLPLGDLTKLTDPLKLGVDAVSPLIKLPAEVSLNRNFFYNDEIKDFAGQEKQFQLPFGGPQFGIDQTGAYVLEQLTGQVGRGLSGYLQRPESVEQDTKFRMPSLGISSILKDFDAQRSAYFEELEKLRKLQDLLDYIEQQTGERPRTINEINRSR